MDGLCSQTLRVAGLEGQSEGAGMTTAPAGKRLLRLKKLSTTQRSARERRAWSLKPCAGAAAALELLEQGFRLKKLSFRSRPCLRRSFGRSRQLRKLLSLSLSLCKLKSVALVEQVKKVLSSLSLSFSGSLSVCVCVCAKNGGRGLTRYGPRY